MRRGRERGWADEWGRALTKVLSRNNFERTRVWKKKGGAINPRHFENAVFLMRKISRELSRSSRTIFFSELSTQGTKGEHNTSFIRASLFCETVSSIESAVTSPDVQIITCRRIILRENYINWERTYVRKSIKCFLFTSRINLYINTKVIYKSIYRYKS